MVPDGLGRKAFDELALSVFEAKDGNRRRYAPASVLKRSDPVTRDQIPPPATTRASRRLLGWVQYMFKNRLYDDPGPDRADLVTTLGWTRHFWIGRTIRQSTQASLDARLRRHKEQKALAETEPERPETRKPREVIRPVSGGHNIGQHAANGAALKKEDVKAATEKPSTSGKRVGAKRDRDRRAGLVRLDIAGLRDDDAAALKAAAAAAKAGTSMVDAVRDSLGRQGRAELGDTDSLGAMQDEVAILRAGAKSAHASLVGLATELRRAQAKLQAAEAAMAGLRRALTVERALVVRTHGEVMILRAELTDARSSLAAAEAGWAADRTRAEKKAASNRKGAGDQRPTKRKAVHPRTTSSATGNGRKSKS